MVLPHDVDVDILTSWAACDSPSDSAALYELPAELRLKLFWPTVAPGGEKFWAIISTISAFFTSDSPSHLKAREILQESMTLSSLNFAEDKTSTVFSADK